MSTNEMRERLRLAMKYPHDCEEALKLEGKVLAFAASEVALALAPREASPELVMPEHWLRQACSRYGGTELSSDSCRAIAAELDRLRALVPTAADERGTGPLRREIEKLKAALVRKSRVLRMFISWDMSVEGMTEILAAEPGRAQKEKRT